MRQGALRNSTKNVIRHHRAILWYLTDAISVLGIHKTHVVCLMHSMWEWYILSFIGWQNLVCYPTTFHWAGEQSGKLPILFWLQYSVTWQTGYEFKTSLQSANSRTAYSCFMRELGSPVQRSQYVVVTQCEIQSWMTSRVQLQKNNAQAFQRSWTENETGILPDPFFWWAWNMWSGNETRQSEGTYEPLYSPPGKCSWETKVCTFMDVVKVHT